MSRLKSGIWFLLSVLSLLIGYVLIGTNLLCAGIGGTLQGLALIFAFIGGFEWDR